MHEKSIATLILAAGSSSRMGRPKQLLPWKGITLIEHVLEQVSAVSKDVFVVLGSHANEVEKYIGSKDCRIIINKNWKEGMGTSISKGITEIEKISDFDAILIAITDQPLLQIEHYKTLKTKFLKYNNGIVATTYQERPGVPAILDRSFFEKLKNLDKDHGARYLFSGVLAQIQLIEPIGNTLDLDDYDTYVTNFKKFGQ